ncbi:hypothetical protein [Amphritea atlantica]|uniref:hypothetical protein n=1 Tax=Amphritea atlantica TaxID=355243 RepID=UPI000B8836A4|nr:hypothetical protein [Amphritea atlantica]
MQTSTKKTISITAVVYAIPIVLCVVFKLVSLGSIGPIVLFYSLAMALVLSYVYYQSMLNVQAKIAAIIIGVFGGVVVATLLLNYFMLLTHLFGIKDYEAI